jgi:hypothetical protein
MELELQVIFNKGAVMVLPTGVNKATGLAAALKDLSLSRHNIAAIGDAENDHALITTAEFGAATANALPSLKAHADYVTPADHGAGVSQLIDLMVTSDLADLAPKRHRVLLGTSDNKDVTFDPYISNLMISGTSGSGKSTVTTGILERLSDADYQFCILDPEGDYAALEFAVVLGSPSRAPLVTEVMDVLRDPQRNAVVNMLGVAVEHRPEFFAQLLPPLVELRTRTGRPHWLVVDEAHHLLPSSWEPAKELVRRPHGTLYVTVHPGSVAKPVIEAVNTLLVVGEHPDKTFKEFAKASGSRKVPAVPSEKMPPGHMLCWSTDSKVVLDVTTEQCRTERARHSRKYVEGNLGSHSFYFRGPDKRLNLKAHNLMLFVLLAEGVDDDTWTFHLRNGEYSKWFRDNVKDPELAEVTEQVERDARMSANASRLVIREAIAKRYTLPADEPSGVVED